MLFLFICGKEEHVGHFAVEYLVVRLVHALQVGVPSGAVQEQSMHVTAVLGRFGDIVFFAVFGDDEEVEVQSIDGVFVLNKNIITFLA